MSLTQKPRQVCGQGPHSGHWTLKIFFTSNLLPVINIPTHPATHLGRPAVGCRSVPAYTTKENRVAQPHIQMLLLSACQSCLNEHLRGETARNPQFPTTVLIIVFVLMICNSEACQLVLLSASVYTTATRGLAAATAHCISHNLSHNNAHALDKICPPPSPRNQISRHNEYSPLIYNILQLQPVACRYHTPPGETHP